MPQLDPDGANDAGAAGGDDPPRSAQQALAQVLARLEPRAGRRTGLSRSASSRRSARRLRPGASGWARTAPAGSAMNATNTSPVSGSTRRWPARRRSCTAGAGCARAVACGVSQTHVRGRRDHLEPVGVDRVVVRGRELGAACQRGTVREPPADRLLLGALIDARPMSSGRSRHGAQPSAVPPAQPLRLGRRALAHTTSAPDPRCPSSGFTVPSIWPIRLRPVMPTAAAVFAGRWNPHWHPPHRRERSRRRSQAPAPHEKR